MTTVGEKMDNQWQVTGFTQERIRDYKNTPLKVRLARTLYNNFYRARIQDSEGEDIGMLLIVPGLPLDRSELPEDAPKAEPYLIVIVEEADINEDTLHDFEECISRKILERFKTETLAFSHCLFYYTSLSQDLILENE